MSISSSAPSSPEQALFEQEESPTTVTRKPSKKHADAELAQARRNQVLNAAADCFRRRGYHGAGMAEISKTAGMSAGHIYNYFASKEAIIEAIIARDMDEMFSVFNQLEAEPGALLDVMVNCADNGVARKLDIERAALQLEMLSEAARNDKVARLLQHNDLIARQRMKQLLRSERSLLRDHSEQDLDARVNIIFTMFGGLLMRRVLNPDLTVDTALQGLRPALRAILLPDAPR